MDAAGKDSTIKHVMSGVNPQGVDVVSFRKPSSEELDHTFLWRTSKAVPERGRIGIFNRSHYEEVVAIRVHPDWLDRQHLPRGERGPAFWDDRYDDINAFERLWHVIPADHKHVMQALVAAVVADTIESLDLRWPTVTDADREANARARTALEAEPDD